jgi:hypothetical protein
VAAVATLLDTLPKPSTDWVDSVYHQLKDNLVITIGLQVERSIQCRAEVTISSLGHSMASWQKATGEPHVAGTTSSLAQLLAHVQLHHPGRCLAPQAHHQAHQGDKDT